MCASPPAGPANSGLWLVAACRVKTRVIRVFQVVLDDARVAVDHVVELVPHPACILDAIEPGYHHTLPRATEMRGDLLGPLERRVEGPGPRHRHVRPGHRRTPGVIITGRPPPAGQSGRVPQA